MRIPIGREDWALKQNQQTLAERRTPPHTYDSKANPYIRQNTNFIVYLII